MADNALSIGLGAICLFFPIMAGIWILLVYGALSMITDVLIWTAVIIALTASTIGGVHFLGSGLDTESIKMIFIGTVAGVFYGALVAAAYPYIGLIPFGWVLNTGLMVVYAFGVFLAITGGG